MLLGGQRGYHSASSHHITTDFSSASKAPLARRLLTFLSRTGLCCSSPSPSRQRRRAPGRKDVLTLYRRSRKSPSSLEQYMVMGEDALRRAGGQTLRQGQTDSLSNTEILTLGSLYSPYFRFRVVLVRLFLGSL